MSLDTVLKIGKALRNAQDSLKYYKYVSPCPTDKDGNYPFCITIPVLEDFSFDWNGIIATPEKRRSSLYYLRFKTSDNDSSMKYMFGDIYYLKTAKIKKDGSIVKGEGGGYRLGNEKTKSSFYRGVNDFEQIIKVANVEKSNLFKFRNAFNRDLDILEKIMDNIPATEYFLKNPSETSFTTFIENESLLLDYAVRQLTEKTSKQNLKKLFPENDDFEFSQEVEKKKLAEFDNSEIFIHFGFPENKNWYDFKEDLDSINEKMLSDFVDKTNRGLVLKKTLYKTLCSGDSKNDIQFPNFEFNAKHKSKAFSDEDIQDLFYAIDYSKKGKLIYGTDVKIIVLPQGDNLTDEDYIGFQSNQDEEKINMANSNDTLDSGEPLFDFLEKNVEHVITAFDVIFSKKGGTAASPDVDLIELSGLEKSNLRNVKQRIQVVKDLIYQKRKTYFSYTTKDFYGFKITSSFVNVLGNPQSDSKTGKVNLKPNPKYQSHMLKTLPMIYTESYYSDDKLLPSFIQNVEYSIRAGDPKFNFIRFDLEFLLSIQNNQNNKFMDIINSDSYLIGTLLGSLARNFAGDQSPIKSFEKNYVGNLSRRISNLSDFIRLKNDIEQKLIMHVDTKFIYQTSYDLAQKVKNFQGFYNKEECAFGFFESYFKPYPKKKVTNQTNNQ